jgi:hypothetical protein
MSRIIGIDFLIRSLHTVVKTILAPNMGLSMEIHPDKCRNHESWLNVLYSDKGDFRLDHDHGHVLLDEKW